MSKRHTYDWFGFWLYFVFGGACGAFAGLRLFSHSSYATSTSMVPIILFIGVGALLGGLLAGFLHEDDGWR